MKKSFAFHARFFQHFSMDKCSPSHPSLPQGVFCPSQRPVVSSVNWFSAIISTEHCQSVVPKPEIANTDTISFARERDDWCHEFKQQRMVQSNVKRTGISSNRDWVSLFQTTNLFEKPFGLVFQESQWFFETELWAYLKKKITVFLRTSHKSVNFNWKVKSITGEVSRQNWPGGQSQ